MALFLLLLLMADGGRIAPPEKLPCADDAVTVYPGRVVSYRRDAKETYLRIETDYDTTEEVTLRHPRAEDVAKMFLVMRRPFTERDFAKIEVRPGVLHPGMRAHAWVCEDGKAIVDWRPDERDATE